MARTKIPDLSGYQDIITISLYGGKSLFGGRDTKYRAEAVTCDCKTCSFRDSGMCLNVTSLAFHTCKYGQKHIFEGYTPQAASCWEWKQTFTSHNKYSKLKSLASDVYFGVVGDYYFIYTAFVGVLWDEDGTYKFQSPAAPKSTHIFIEKSKVDIDFLVKLLTYTPYSFAGGEIKDYRKQVVTLILKQMQDAAPELYAAVVEANPVFAEVAPNFVGKRVYVKGLKPDIDIYIPNYGMFHLSADRKTMTCTDYCSALLPFGAKTAKIEIPVTDDMVYKVQSNDETCEDTRIAK